MINYYLRPALIIGICLFLYECSPNTIDIKEKNVRNQEAPSWYPRPANDELYFQGVGSASFNDNVQTTIDIAKANAISDLVSQISVSIKNSISDSVWETAGQTGEEFRKSIKMEIEKENISDVIVVDTWIKKPFNEAWVYVHLNKQLYFDKQKKRNQDLTKNILQLLDDGSVDYQKDKYGNSLKSFIGAYYYSQGIVGNAYNIEYPRYSGNTVNMNGLISNKINSIVQYIEFQALSIPATMKSFDKQGEAIQLRAVLNLPSRGIYPLENIPVQFICNEDNVHIPSSMITGLDGVVENYFTTDGVYADSLLISVKLNLNSINVARDKSIKTGKGFDLSKIFMSSTRHFTIDISPINIYVVDSEKIDGNAVLESEKFVSHSITQTITNRGGFSIVDNLDEADLLLEIIVDCNYQNSSMDLINYTAYISVNLYKSSFDNKVYTAKFRPVDGYGLDKRQAGITTLEEAGN